MRNSLPYDHSARIYLLSLGFILGIGQSYSVPAQKSLLKNASEVSTNMANLPDSCISYYADGQPISKSIFKYNPSGLLGLDSGFAWNEDKQLWQLQHQTEYGYGTNGNLLSEIGIRYNESNESSYYYKNIFTYTDENDLSAQEYYIYNAENQSLVGLSRFEYFYNASGSPDSVIEYSKSDTQNNWIPSSKSIYGYTNDTMQSSYEIYKYDASALTWTKYIKNTQTYNSAAQLQDEQNYTASDDDEWTKYSRTQNEYLNGKLTSSVTYNSDGSDWVAASKASYEYSNAKVVAKVTSLYNANSLAWTNAFKDSIEYLTNGKLSKQTAFKWDHNSASWIAVSRDIYNYDSGNALEQYFYSSNGAWIGIQKRVLKYDASGNNISDEKYGWGQESNSWIPASKIEKMYDGDTQKLNSSIKYSLGSDNGWQGYIKQDYEYEVLFDSSIGLKFAHNYDNKGSGWAYSNYTKFFYSAKETSIDNREALNLVRVAWFPEQFISVASNIEIIQVNVYFVNGTQKFTGKSQRISTNAWETGIYIVKVETADGKRTVRKINVF
jgi:hypothetical protein